MDRGDDLKRENHMLARWCTQIIWTAVAFICITAVLFFLLLALAVAWLGGSLTVDCSLLTDKHCAISIDL